MNESEQRIEALEKLIKALPEAMQNAICWMIENIDIVNQLAEGEAMTEMEVEQFTQSAIEKKDYLMLALVLYKQIKDRDETETKQQEN